MSDRPNIFVAEFLSGGGTSRVSRAEVSPSMAAEAVAMWQALVEDLSEFCDVVTPVDPNWNLPVITPRQVPHGTLAAGAPATGTVTMVPVLPAVMPWQQWIRIASDCDSAILVVPETDGLLAQGIGMLRAAGIQVLAPGPETLRLTADKWLTARFLKQAGIAHPPTFERADARCRKALAGCRRFVLKPRDGCGSTDVRVCHSLEEAIESMQPADLLQGYCEGRAASILTIASPSSHALGHSIRATLPGVWQTLGPPDQAPDAVVKEGWTKYEQLAGHASDQQAMFHYNGGSGPLEMELQRRIEALTARVLQQLPGCIAGFIGIDVVLGADANHDVVIEINPRLTTSYIGMRRMVSENLTRRLFTNNPTAVTVCTPPDSVLWTTNGEIHQR